MSATTPTPFVFPCPDDPPPPPPSTAKNIVIFCDGTGNQFGNDNSNVVKLYTAMVINNEQVGYYHPGVGTMAAPGAHSLIQRAWSKAKGLAFGAGFKDNVLDAYRYLMDTYNDGDRVFLFGFSRGAYTARALAGLLSGYGLLCKGNEGHIPYAWADFTRRIKEIKAAGKSTLQPDAGADAFKQTFSHEHFKLHFVGVWDTVSSVGWISTPLRLPDVAYNPIILTGRHAVSIDERRCFFVDNLWGTPLAGQDIVQAWFAGVHSDVGGSYAQPGAALANITLKWMLEEARIAGIKVHPDRELMIFGETPTKCKWAAAPMYEKPKPYSELHKSLHGPWWILEFLPHRYYSKDDVREQWRMPLCSPRELPSGALLHPSVMERMDGGYGYAPKNIERAYMTAPGIPATNPTPTIADLTGFANYNSPLPNPHPPLSHLIWSFIKRWSLILLVVLLDILVPLLIWKVLHCLGSCTYQHLWINHHGAAHFHHIVHLVFWWEPVHCLLRCAHRAEQGIVHLLRWFFAACHRQ